MPWCCGELALVGQQWEAEGLGECDVHRVIREEVWVPGTVSLLPAPDCHIRGMLSSWVEPRSAARAMRSLAPAGTLLAARQATRR